MYKTCLYNDSTTPLLPGFQVDAICPRMLLKFTHPKNQQVLRRIHNTVQDCQIWQTSVKHMVFIITLNFRLFVSCDSVISLNNDISFSFASLFHL